MKIFVTILIFLVLTACGKVVNPNAQSEAFTQNLSFVLMEHQCAKDPNLQTEIFKNISTLLQNALKNTPGTLYSNGKTMLFDSLHPMIVSLAGLQTEYSLIASNPSIHSLDEILLLYNKAQRFEDLHCSLGSLVEKENSDIRPYYSLENSCFKNSENGDCAESDYANNREILKDIMNLCEAFNSPTHCQAEYKLTKAAGGLTSLVQKYRKMFLQDKIDTLFHLRVDHLSFNCQKEISPETAVSSTVMTIPIFAEGMDAQTLKDILSYAELQWKNDGLKMRFEIMKASTRAAIQIISIAGGISHVPNDDTHLIYLNASLPANQMARVFAHELGHVLGFPDCYIEYFNSEKKELVYYELGAENMNIMCSMKEGVRVPADYFVQLEQSSCNFR